MCERDSAEAAFPKRERADVGRRDVSLGADEVTPVETHAVSNKKKREIRSVRIHGSSARVVVGRSRGSKAHENKAGKWGQTIACLSARLGPGSY